MVLEELRRDLDAPGRQLSRAVAAESWHHHPYRRPVAGTVESVRTLDAGLLSRFHQRWFRRSRITVVAVGDVDPDRARALLAEAFAATADSGPAPVRRRAAEPEQLQARCLVREGPFEAARFELAFPGVAVADPDTPLLDLLVLCLGQGRASRLNREVRLRRRLVDGLAAGSWSPLDPGQITLSGLTSTDRVLKAVEASVDELARLTTDLLDEEELERAKACIEAERDYERETMDGQARTLGYWTAGARGDGSPAARPRPPVLPRDAAHRRPAPARRERRRRGRAAGRGGDSAAPPPGWCRRTSARGPHAPTCQTGGPARSPARAG